MNLDYLGVPPEDVIPVMLSVAGLYLVFAGMLSLTSQRLFSSPSSLNLAMATVLGAVVGRAMLGPEPSLATGVIALSTLVGLELATGRLRHVRVQGSTRERAEPLVVAGAVNDDVMHRRHLTEQSLWGLLRSNGIAHLDDAALVVLERSGRYSVVRRGQAMHPDVLTGLQEKDEVWRRLVDAGHAPDGRGRP